MLQNPKVGVADTFKKITKEEGYLGLYKGSMLKLLQFAVYKWGINISKEILVDLEIFRGSKEALVINILAHQAVVLFAYPLDTIRVRYTS